MVSGQLQYMKAEEARSADEKCGLIGRFHIDKPFSSSSDFAYDMIRKNNAYAYVGVIDSVNDSMQEDASDDDDTCYTPDGFHWLNCTKHDN